MRFLILITFSFFLSCKVFALESDYQIVTQDVFHFWTAYDSLKYTKDSLGVFQRQVIDKATTHFAVFIKQRNITAKNYVSQLKAYPQFYASMRKYSLRLCNSETEIKQLIQKLRDIYPKFIAADICIGFGNFMTGGTVSVSKDHKYVYIGLEYHGVDSSVITKELNFSTRDYVSRSNFFRTLIHELVHVQQATHGKKLIKEYEGNKLANAIIREGVPEFIASLVYPYGNKGNHFAYGIANEEILKEKLSTDLWQTDLSYWIFNSNTVKDQPRDMGYFMGYRIAETYYKNNFTNIKKTITEIIEVKNLKDFIKKSKYFKDY